MDSRCACPLHWRGMLSLSPKLFSMQAALKRQSRTKQMVHLQRMKTQDTHGKLSLHEPIFLLQLLLLARVVMEIWGFSTVAFHCLITSFKRNYRNNKSLTPDHNDDCDIHGSSTVPAAASWLSWLWQAGRCFWTSWRPRLESTFYPP